MQTNAKNIEQTFSSTDLKLCSNPLRIDKICIKIIFVLKIRGLYNIFKNVNVFIQISYTTLKSCINLYEYINDKYLFLFLH
jgi:hypothetical protein